jgi:hypothetical protein
LDLKKRVGQLLGKMSDYKQFMMAVATMDVKCLCQLVRTALNRNVSIKRIVHLMQDALDGHYHARDYDTDDTDLIALVHHLGGSKLLHAVSKATGLPSLRMLKRRRKLISIWPSIASIQGSEIDYNLASLFGSPGLQPQDRKLTGHSILIDEISLEERACYLPWANQIGGICREHAAKADLHVTSFEAVDKVADLLEAGVCHIGREATVAAIASFGSEDYHAMPFLLSPTCKMEKAPEQAEWIKLAMDRWRPYESSRGPLWSIATDGDTTRRAALHSILMAGLPDPSGKLFEVLGNLPGLNLQCGENDVTMDGEPKHILKSKPLTTLAYPLVFTFLH